MSGQMELVSARTVHGPDPVPDLAAVGLDWLGYPTIPVPDAHHRTWCRF
ncbi:hypothetical protein [Streptomyces antimycoticus]